MEPEKKEPEKNEEKKEHGGYHCDFYLRKPSDIRTAEEQNQEDRRIEEIADQVIKDLEAQENQLSQ